MTNPRITPFLFEGEIPVRAFDRDGAPCFVAADVCRALCIANPSQAIRQLDEDERGLCSVYTPGGDQQMLVVSESGLFTLILRCREAVKKGTLPHRFGRWVTSEVLPSLRQHGTYSIARLSTSDPTSPRKPYGEWSLEETRVALAQVNTAYRTLSPGAAAWMWERVGLPTPPKHLLPPWRQGDLLGRSFGISS